MRRFYGSLAIGWSLLTGLPSCSQQAASEQPATPVLPVSAVSAAETKASDAVCTTNSWAFSGAGKLAGPVVRHKVLASYRIEPRVSAVSSLLADTAARWPLRVPSAAETQGAADTAYTKPAQVFRIRADQDTLLVGLEGTTVWVPAQVFEQNHLLVGSAEVEVHLREYYTLADMLLQRLSTTAGPVPLETAGMVQLTATAHGQPCTLRQGSSLEVSFPTRQVQENMQLFQGAYKPGHLLDWQPAPHQGARTTQERPWRRPLYSRGYGGMREQLRRQVVFTAAMAERCAAQRHSRSMRRWLRHFDQQVSPVGAVVSTFVLSASGQLTEVRSLTASAPELTASVLQALHGSTARWRPALTGQGLAVRSQLTVEVLFTADQRVLVKRLWWNETVTRQLYRADQLKRDTVAARQLQGAALEVADYLFQTTGYTFQCARLGWLNCDQFINFVSPLIRQRVASASAQTDVSLVLKARRTVLRGGLEEGCVHFERVPQGEAATLVAIRRDQKQLYLALRDMVISHQLEPALEFRPVTERELKAAIAQLEPVQ